MTIAGSPSPGSPPTASRCGPGDGPMPPSPGGSVKGAIGQLGPDADVQLIAFGAVVPAPAGVNRGDRPGRRVTGPESG